MQTRWLYALLIACCCLAQTALAGGQPTPVVLSAGGALTEHLPMVARESVPVQLTIQEIAADTTAAFAPFDPRKTYDLTAQHALWLHFRVLAQEPPAPSGWTLEFPKPYIDRVEFYHRTAQGGWAMQAAGDTIANQRWPQPGLYPQFQLPPLAAGVHDFYVKVQQVIPLHFSVHLQRTDQANLANQKAFLVFGLLLGLMVLMFGLSCVLALAYGDGVYAWYALYVALAFFAAASFIGIANCIFWPQSPWWPDISAMTFMMLSMAAQLQFCRKMFVAPATCRWMHHLVSGAIVLNLVATSLRVAFDDVDLRLVLVPLAVGPCALLMVVMVGRALRQRSKIAALWLLAYTPLLCIVPLALIEHLGIATLTWLPYHTPIYALVFEVPVLLVALHLHAKALHAKAVRHKTLAATDPLTGFIPEHLYPDTLARLWLKALQAKSDLTVAYVQASPDNHERTIGGTVDKKRTVLRTVRMLRTVAREDDAIARISEHVYAILMPGVSRSDALAVKLSRLVALGLMQDQDDRLVIPIQFKVLASSLRSFTGSPEQLHTAMQVALRQPGAWAQRSIRFLPESQRASG